MMQRNTTIRVGLKIKTDVRGGGIGGHQHNASRPEHKVKTKVRAGEWVNNQHNASRPGSER
jgi:hypothetical protein